MELNKVYWGDCLEELKKLPENSVDSIITDPPYELGFMGKSWDSTGIANNVDLWKECLRVLKPGGHLLAFSGTRTYHRMACAIEDAGFEVRDMIEWVYGSGFPKSLNIGKAVDKFQGNEREVVGVSTGKGYSSQQEKNKAEGFRPYEKGLPHEHADRTLTKGNSEWEGWGTALKPAHEPICMARKPLSEKTVAKNCLKWGTGGINIDESRVGTEKRFNSFAGNKDTGFTADDNRTDAGKGLYAGNKEGGTTVTGRFPANLIHDNSEEVRECFPETNASKSANRGLQHSGRHGGLVDIGGNIKVGTDTIRGHDDNGGNASRFFKSIIYQAKAGKSDRGKGNNHATVKPTTLMEYLIKMVTREGQTVLDIFGGSGTTGVACKNTGRNYILIEKEKEYIDIINKRLEDESHRIEIK